MPDMWHARMIPKEESNVLVILRILILLSMFYLLMFLKYNLLNVSQLYDKSNKVIFKSLHCLVIDIIENKIIS
jgi:hypothetical protein